MRAFPFDSQITGYDEGGIPQYDRASNSEELARLLSSFLCDGVFGQGMCAVTAGSGMKASIGTGCCLIQGRYGYLETAHEVTFDAASTANPRIDTVVLRRDLSGNVRNIVCAVVKGTADASPIPPTLTRDGTVWELGLANVLIPKNATGILQANITDTRLDTERCGIVAAINTDIDTSELYAQIQTDLAWFKGNEESNFIAWFSSLVDMLDGNVAANLGAEVLSLTDALQSVADRTEAVEEAVKIKQNPNLLDNWYFARPINQRDVSGTITTSGYFIDRWKLESGSVQITNSGLLLNGTIVQILEFPIGQSTKASVLTSAGVEDAAYSDATKTFTITASGKTILAAKLELGSSQEAQSLAHQENSAWVLNEIPDYREQLAKCQRYLFKMNKYQEERRTLGSGWSWANSEAGLLMPTPVPMRTNPVMIGTLNVVIIMDHEAIWSTSNANIMQIRALDNGIYIRFKNLHPYTGTPDSICIFYLHEQSDQLLSAEL